MSAAAADHKHDLYDAVGKGGAGHVQVDHRAARAVGIDRVGARFLSFRCEIGLASRPKAVADVITLCEVALAVESLDTCHNLWWPVRKARWSVRRNSEGVFALERRVRAPAIIVSPGHAGQRRQSDCSRKHSFPKPACHVRPFLGMFVGMRVERLCSRITRKVESPSCDDAFPTPVVHLLL